MSFPCRALLVCNVSALRLMCFVQHPHLTCLAAHKMYPSRCVRTCLYYYPCNFNTLYESIQPLCRCLSFATMCHTVCLHVSHCIPAKRVPRERCGQLGRAGKVGGEARSGAVRALGGKHGAAAGLGPDSVLGGPGTKGKEILLYKYNIGNVEHQPFFSTEALSKRPNIRLVSIMMFDTQLQRRGSAMTQPAICMWRTCLPFGAIVHLVRIRVACLYQMERQSPKT